jgi:UDP-N-acetylmuramate dehydrogenase
MFNSASYFDRVKTNVSADNLTTLKVGGPIDYLVDVKSIDELVDVVDRAKKNKYPVVVLGQGSNVIVSDEGLRGVVVRLQMFGSKVDENDDTVKVEVEAGVLWDEFVKDMVSQGFAGVEAISGVPGTVGAAPVQNIGCYGQELADTFVELTAYDTKEQKIVTYRKEQCKFGYRSSFFKKDPTRRYIILSVTLELSKGFLKMPQYPDVQTFFLKNKIMSPSLSDLRSAILEIRRSKSMLLDESDINSHSVGSFFTNPIINRFNFRKLQSKFGDIPYYDVSENEVKIPAAWLVEKAGFVKGYTSGKVGISSKHSLAIINLGGGSTKDVLDLADKIQHQVYESFGINIDKEPVLLGF